MNVRRLEELDGAFKLAKERNEALIVLEDGLFLANASHVAELALRNQLPSIGFREYCEGGGLVGYGVDFPHIWRQPMVSSGGAGARRGLGRGIGQPSCRSSGDTRPPPGASLRSARTERAEASHASGATH